MILSFFALLSLFSLGVSEFLEFTLKTAVNDSHYYTEFQLYFNGGQTLVMTPSFAFQTLVLANNSQYSKWGFNCTLASTECQPQSFDPITFSIKGEEIGAIQGIVDFQANNDGIDYDFNSIPVILTDKMPDVWIESNVLGIGANPNYFMEKAAQSGDYNEDSLSVFINMNSYENFDFSAITVGEIDLNYLSSKHDEMVTLNLAESSGLQESIGNQPTYFNLSNVFIESDEWATSSSYLTVTLAERELCVPKSDYAAFLSALCPTGCANETAPLKNISFSILSSSDPSGLFNLTIDPYHYYDQNAKLTFIKSSEDCLDVDDDAWGFGLIPASRYFWAVNGSSNTVQVGASICFEGPRSFLVVYIIVGGLALCGVIAIIFATLNLFIAERRIMKEIEEEEAKEDQSGTNYHVDESE